jgi:Transglycosylase SLT domain
MPIKIGIEADISSAKGQLNDLMSALMKTGQAGKGLSDIKLNPKQFSEAAEQLKYLKQEFESWKKTAEGGIAVRRASKFGQQADAPWKWDWDAMYASRTQAQKKRNQFWFRMTGQEPTAPAQAQPLVPARQAPAGGFLSQIGQRSMAGAGSAASGIGSVIGKFAGIAVGGSIAAAVIGAVRTGYREHESALSGFDATYRKLAGAMPWDELTDKVRGLASELHLTAGEAASLASTFQSVSGAADATAIDRVAFSERFGRGFGMQKGEAAQGFAQAEYLGVGGTRSSQRDFATLLAETISGGSMFARSSQVMGDLLGYIKSSESRTARVTPSAELERYAAFRAETYQNPALRGATGDALLQKSAGLLQGGSAMHEMFLYRALGKDINYNPVFMDMIKGANVLQTPFEATDGRGSKTDTILERLWETAKKYGEAALKGMDDVTPREKTAFAMHTLSPGLSMQQALALNDVLEKHGGNFGGFAKWMKEQGVDVMKTGGSAFEDLSKLYSGEDPKAIAKKYLEEGSEISPKERELIEKNLNNAEKLRKILPGIVANAGMPMNEFERFKEATTELKNELEKHVGQPVTAMVTTVQSGLAGAVRGIGNFFSSFNSAASKFNKEFEEYVGVVEQDWDSIKNSLETFVAKVGGLVDKIEKFFSFGEVPDYDPVNGKQSPAKPVPSGSMARDPGFMDMLSGIDKGKGFSPGTMEALMMQESGGRVDAYNKESGATGLFQFLKSTAGMDMFKKYGLITPEGKVNKDPRAQAFSAAAYLSYLMKRFGNEKDAIIAYNMGEGNLAKLKKGAKRGDLAHSESIDFSFYENVMEQKRRLAELGYIKKYPGYKAPTRPSPGGLADVGRTEGFDFDALFKQPPSSWGGTHDSLWNPAIPKSRKKANSQEAEPLDFDALFASIGKWKVPSEPPLAESLYPTPDFTAPQIPENAEAAVRYNTIPSIADARLGGQIDVNVQQVDHMGRRVRQLTRQTFRPEPRLAGTVDVGVLSGSRYRPGTLGTG